MRRTNGTLRRRLAERGFVILDRCVDRRTLRQLGKLADAVAARGRTRGGTRNLLQRSAALRRMAEQGPVAVLARRLIGDRARPAKLTLFDKTATANWKIRWHQDVTICVRRRIDADGFSGWSRKEGVLHVRAPAEVLGSVLALRLHLDDTPAANGALRVLPGSHRQGRLSAAQIHQLRQVCDEVVCEVAAGGVMAMRPLLLHASSAATEPSRRRVLHFEYSATGLPGGLQWA